jgi:hypothetical protein
MKCVLERSQKAIIHFGRYVQIELGFRTPESSPRFEGESDPNI